MIALQNPYIEPLHIAHRNDNKTEIELYTRKSKEFLQSKLEEAGIKRDKIIEEIKIFKEQPMDIKITRQYKDAINLYREATDLVLQMRDIKRLIREQMITNNALAE